MKFAFYSRVIRIEKRSRKCYVRGVGADTVFNEQDLGWWMILADSHEALYMGSEQPNFKENDIIKVTFERQEPINANPQQPSVQP